MKQLLNHFRHLQSALVVATVAVFTLASCSDDKVQEIILNNDIAASFSAGTANAQEDGGAITINVSFPAAAPTAIALQVAVTGTADAADYSTDPAIADGKINLGVAEGDESASFTFTPVDNDVLDGDRTVEFTLQAATGITLGTNAKITVTIKDDETPDASGVTMISEDFESYELTAFENDYAPFTAEGWMNEAEAGSEKWEVKDDDDGNQYVEYNAYNTEEDSNIGWLVLPKIDFSNLSVQEMSFRSVEDFEDDVTLLELFYSADFDGSGAGLATATWTAVAFTAPDEETNDWTDSGTISLSEMSGNGHLAFKYTGSGTAEADATFRIDDLYVGVSPPPAPVLTITETLADFGEVANGTTSAEQMFTISGENLIGDVTISAPANFEVSLTTGADFVSEVILTDASTEQTIFVRFAPASGINKPIMGELTVSTEGTDDEAIAVSGTETGNTPPVATGIELYISEYAESAGGNHKYIEIYNPTDAAIELTDYQLWGSSNGSDWKDPERKLQLVGTIYPGDVFVISTDDANADILAQADMTRGYESPVHHNGDDAIGLFKSDGAADFDLIDVIGVPTEDPGNGWAVAGVVDATKDHTLVRKSTISSGQTDWATAAGTTAEDSEWVVMEANEFSNVGVHTTTAPELD